MILNYSCKQTIRISLDLLYQLQLLRVLTFNKKLDRYIIKQDYINNILEKIEQISVLSNSTSTEFFIINLNKAITDYLHSDTYTFIKYTDDIIQPVLDYIEDFFKDYKQVKEISNYLQLINIIEQISLQREILCLLSDEEISKTFVINFLKKYNFLIELLDYNELVSLDKALLKNKNNVLSVKEYFDVLLTYINQLTNLEKRYLEKIFEVQNPSIDKNYYLELKNIFKTYLNEYYINLVISKGKILVFDKKSVISKELNHFYICLSGMIKSYLVDDSGNESIMDLFDKGSFFYTNFFITETSLEILDDNTTIFSIPMENIIELTNKSQEIKMFFDKLYINFILEKNTYISNLVSKKAKHRLANFLIKQNLDNNLFKFGKYNIARHLNMTPETFSRVLKYLNEEKKRNKNYLCNYCSEVLYDKCNVKNLEQNHCIYKEKNIHNPIL